MEIFVKSNKGHSLRIHDTPGEKGTIIAVHGLTGNHKQFHHYQEALKGKYRFISYDVRGRGNSDAASKETSIFTHAEDLVEIIHLLKIKNPILMGYSMGAYVCAIAASQLSNVKALILLDGTGQADDMSRQLVLPSLKRLEKVYDSVEDYVSEVEGLYTNLDVNWTDTLADIVSYEVKKNREGYLHKSNRTAIEQDFESFYTFTPEIICSDITAKTLLFIATGKIGGKSPLFQEEGYKKTRACIQGLQVKYTPVNHYELVFNEQSTIVNQIEDFLEEVE